MPRLKSLGIWGAIHAYAAKYRHWIGEGSLIGKMGSDKIRTGMVVAVCTSYDRPDAVSCKGSFLQVYPGIHLGPESQSAVTTSLLPSFWKVPQDVPTEFR